MVQLLSSIENCLGGGVRVKRRSKGKGKKKSLWLASVATVVVSGCFPHVYVRAAGILELVFLLCAAQHVGLDFIAVT